MVKDTTAPTLHLPSAITVYGTSSSGAAVSFTATATDAVDGSVPVTCVPPSGTVFGYVPTTVHCSATDSHGNTASGSFLITVLHSEVRGFYQPVDTLPTVNTVKGGSTVPLKFEIFAGTTEITSTSGITFDVVQVNCSTNAPLDEIEMTSTGGTSLRYDGGQFIQNWKTPTGAGKCYLVTVYSQDGSSKSALFKMK
jgi:hypothetical protein